MLQSTADISPCTLFRYYLKRVWAPGDRICLWCMLNPSTADAEKNDATITKCIGFSQRWDCTGLVVVNLYAFRATHPEDLKAKGYLVGQDNDDYIGLHSLHAHKTVAAWGANAVKSRADAVLKILKSRGDVHCLGKTQMGFPKHPLLVKYDTVLEKM